MNRHRRYHNFNLFIVRKSRHMIQYFPYIFPNSKCSLNTAFGWWMCMITLSFDKCSLNCTLLLSMVLAWGAITFPFHNTQHSGELHTCSQCSLGWVTLCFIEGARWGDMHFFPFDNDRQGEEHFASCDACLIGELFCSQCC